jgi:hypothetical protein
MRIQECMTESVDEGQVDQQSLNTPPEDTSHLSGGVRGMGKEEKNMERRRPIWKR